MEHAAGPPRAALVRAQDVTSDRVFFRLCALWFVALTFVGFAPTFYLRALPEPLPANLIVHGILNSTWVLLFLLQAQLIASRRPRWHMALGVASLSLLVVMLVFSFNVVLVKAAAGLKSVDEAGANLTELTLAFLLALAGLAQRRRPFVHKRLMLFATMALTVAAADRVAFRFGFEHVRLVRKLLAATPGCAVVAYDAWRLRRLPLLSLALLAVLWLVIWFDISDVVFLHPSGETLLRLLMKIFVGR